MKFKPGDHKDDVRHLFEGHRYVLTNDEQRARMNIIFAEKLVMPADHSEIDGVNPRWRFRQPEVLELLKNGVDEFYAETFRRVLRESPEKLVTCPKCGSLCRTCWACLCPHCSHSWYEVRNGS